MLKESANNTEIGNIHVAADLLRRMLWVLESLAVHNAQLHFAMTDTGHAIRQRLDMLSGIAELLERSHAHLHARALCRRAKTLIFQLTGELEGLARQAERELVRHRPMINRQATRLGRLQ